MQAGRLTQRVRIEQPVVTRNALGEEILGWTTFAEVWAEVRPLSTRELVTLRAEYAEVTTMITIRYRPGITAKMRVLHGDAIYRIEPPAPLGENSARRELRLLAAAESVAS